MNLEGLFILLRGNVFFPYNLSSKIQYLLDKGSQQKQELFVGQG